MAPHKSQNQQNRKTVCAKTIWELIIKEAWSCGDSGRIFLDTVNESNPTPKIGTISYTNPCGELPLLDYTSCTLGSINLSKMVQVTDGLYQIDWESLSNTIGNPICI